MKVFCKERETYSVSPQCVCVGYELSSRAVASQVFSPLQRLTSVFGMGTGGPTALKTLTHIVRPRGPTIQNRFRDWCTSGDSNPGPTD